MAHSTVHLLPLSDSGAPDVPDQYIYLPPPYPKYTLRFEIDGTSSVTRQGSLWVNVPKQGEKFDRRVFQEFKLEPDFHKPIHVDLTIPHAGAFSYYITYSPLPEFSLDKSSKNDPKPTQTETYYFDVAPRLSCNGEYVPLPALSIFSLLSKFMGKYPEDWKPHLRGISQRGYNMIHFTPLMQPGASKSPYSIYDQLRFDPATFPNGEEDVAQLVRSMEQDYNLMGLTDVVWNHTAHNSKWLEEHPEAGYNALTAPHLEAAEVFDTELKTFSDRLAELGYPTDLKDTNDLLKVMEGIKKHVIPACKLWEFYAIDVQSSAKAAVQAWIDGDEAKCNSLEGAKSWSLKQKADFLYDNKFQGRNRMGGRYSRKPDSTYSAALLTAIYGPYGSTSVEEAHQAIARILDEMNLPSYREYDEDQAAAKEQIFNRIKYVRLDDHGPKAGPITEASPMVEPYFTHLLDNEVTRKHDPRSLALVNNGWVWAADAMRDNAGPDSKTYLRREVIVWGDCVKLRYGKRREDSPYLWDRMAEYTRLMAKYFSAFRIDNCHSTPIAVAEYMLDQARQVRPDLAVCAELFSGSEDMDWVFVKRLGLSALIREAMQAGSTQELSRLVHRHAGPAIGSFETDDISQRSGGEVVHRVKRSPLHALFMDCTHDNELPTQKRDARDTLPNAALVNMCASATGSVMSYDEIYPRQIELVHETRLYTSKSSEGEVKVGPGKGGIGGIKQLLNRIHVQMGKEGYDETYIDHQGELITVHRVHPKTRKGYFLIAHTAFPGYGSGNGGLQPVKLAGSSAKLIGAWKLEVDANAETIKKVVEDKTHLRGLPSEVSVLDGVSVESNAQETVLKIPEHFPPGSIALFETSIPSCEHSDGLDRYATSGADLAMASLNLIDLNFLMYRADAEEKDFSGGSDGTYNIPNHGNLVYCGLQGWWSVLKNIVRNNDLGHPLCNHLREGQWAMDYIVGRLRKIGSQDGFTNLKKPAEWLESRFNAIRKIPNFLQPRYFALIIQTAYTAAWNRGISLMADDVHHGQKFLQQLSMVSCQMTGYTKSASLWPKKNVPSLAAGLPHFASSWARAWGRDVFISMRGLFLGTGRFDDAKEHILAFGSVLKHGQIPNLLGSGGEPRYNSRDSIWFYLQNIQDYTKIVPDGKDLLREDVPRRFLPYDDTWFPVDDQRAYSKKSTVEDIVQEALQRHASGMSYREANAGDKVDFQMSSEGFNIKIHVDWKTGIIFGGNQHNCGTWMDKMGESPKAGSKGVPGTPRDGAAVEITGLLFSTLKWLDESSAAGTYKYKGVDTPQGKITWSEWANLLKTNFERCYYIPTDKSQDSDFDVESKIVNRRGIYKDLYKSGKPYEDYQLRPNVPIAMTVAPELFTPERALGHLIIADKALLGPTGTATLDPSDMNYRPYYINSEDSEDFATSKGRNYHQGPEWLWPTGFFLRALLKFDLLGKDTKQDRVESFQQVTRRLTGCKEMIENSPWAGLTELTQKNGEFCGDSCPTQAWSASCLIDLFMDARDLGINN